MGRGQRGLLGQLLGLLVLDLGEVLSIVLEVWSGDLGMGVLVLVI